ncbi:hypothetical protein Pcac1_g16299 [Phytophthora cactorum]|nr:hypothetical protein Pcac1_g16299 [Phytophthora cactorum]KAG2811404.1 hypothetical protein PC111_g15252 [Phytophthora cactorum]KAG3003635.1 hypothetical protein PC119_g15897 [Phytophthora cactorum]
MTSSYFWVEKTLLSELSIVIRPDEEDFVGIWGSAEAPTNIPESDSVNPAVCPTTTAPDAGIGHIMNAFSSLGLLEAVAEKTTAFSASERALGSVESVPHMRKWITDPSIDNDLVDVPCSTADTDIEPTAVIELLDEALVDSSNA